MKTMLVAVCAVRDGDRYAWVRFGRNYLKGYLGLPGGKFEEGEYLPEAAVREIKEELGIETVFRTFHGVVDEIVHTPDEHFRCLLFVCSLAPTGPIERGPESPDDGIAAIEWLTADELAERRAETVPSDIQVFRELIEAGQTGYWKCQQRTDAGGPPQLDFFDRVGDQAV